MIKKLQTTFLLLGFLGSGCVTQQEGVKVQESLSFAGFRLFSHLCLKKDATKKKAQPNKEYKEVNSFLTPQNAPLKI
jgi:hypothetical protein